MTDPNRAGSESRTVDALLSDFFRAERPKVWPPAPRADFAAASPVGVATVPSALAGKRRLGAGVARGRFTLAASAALLLAAVLAVTPDAALRPAAPATAAGPNLMKDSNAQGPLVRPPSTPKPGEVGPRR